MIRVLGVCVGMHVWAVVRLHHPCGHVFQVYECPVQVGEYTQEQLVFLDALLEMGYKEEDVNALKECGPHLSSQELVFRYALALLMLWNGIEWN